VPACKQTFLCSALVELEARESAAGQSAARDQQVKEQQTKDAAKQLEQEVLVHSLVFVCLQFSVIRPYMQWRIHRGKLNIKYAWYVSPAKVYAYRPMRVRQTVQ